MVVAPAVAERAAVALSPAVDGQRAEAVLHVVGNPDGRARVEGAAAEDEQSGEVAGRVDRGGRHEPRDLLMPDVVLTDEGARALVEARDDSVGEGEGRVLLGAPHEAEDAARDPSAEDATVGAPGPVGAVR